MLGKGKKDKKKKKLTLGNVNMRGVFAVIFLVADLAFLGYRGYMQLEVRNQKKIQTQKEQEIVDKTKLLSEENDHVGIKKFNAAKYVALNAENTDWKGSTEYLIRLFDTLTAIDQSDRTITLESYSISDDKVSIEGEVASLQTIYREGGLLDKIEELEFMKSITIPSYALGEEVQGYGFTLNAEIFKYEG